MRRTSCPLPASFPMKIPPSARPCLLILLVAFAGPVLRAGDAPAVLATESAAAKAKRLEWFRHDKFGLFIHWGLYAIPAGYWHGQRSPGIGEWVMNRMQIPVGEYALLATQFNPVQFDADAWAQLAEDAGMKYVVITSKHHDGFALFRSAASPYNVYDATPFHRDVVKELAAACAKHGLRFGVYYSQSQDWHEPGGTGNNWDFPSNEEKDKSGAYDAYLRKKVEPQLRELLTNYGPICLIWFDTPQMMTGDRPKRLTERRPDLPAWLESLIIQAIAPDPEDRFQDGFEMAFKLETGAYGAEPDFSKTHSWWGRNEVVVWRIVSLLLALALGAMLFLHGSGMSIDQNLLDKLAKPFG